MSLPMDKKTWVGTDANGQEVNYGDLHELMHRDMATGNEYRKERIKHLITLATGVFALTVTFHKDLFEGGDTADALVIMFAGWTFLLLSLLTGIFHFRAWEDYYLSYRKDGNALWSYFAPIASNKPNAEISAASEMAAVKSERDKKRFRLWDRCQTWFLVIGLACTGIYVGLSAQSWLVNHKQSKVAASKSGSMISRITAGSVSTNSSSPRSDAN
jgi:hypothetical protein